VTTLILDYPVSANRYWRQVVLNGHPQNIRTKEARAYIEAVRWHVNAGCIRRIHGRVSVDLKLYPARPADWQKRQRDDPHGWSDSVRCIDLDNARKVVYDAIKGVLIEDDSWIHVDSGERMVPDADGARVVLTIAPLPLRAIPGQQEIEA
jgi:crossover junction endodeoxyribonuclease RusA